MPELLLELFSEEIPARMQARAAEDLKRLMSDRMKAAGLSFETARAFVTPRRLTLVVEGLPARQPDVKEEKKGPKVGAPDQALQGFMKANGLADIAEAEQRETPKGTFFFLVRQIAGRPAAEVLPGLVSEAAAALAWPKSMRWGHRKSRWVRPLHGILAVFDGAILAGSLDLGGEVLAFGGETRGHRFLAPDAIPVTDFADYQAKLRAAKVVLDAEERRATILAGAEELAKAEGLTLKADEGLLAEVAGLVEWPVVLIGRIAPHLMALPPEVLTTSMKAHQKYFSTLTAEGTLADRFIFVANMENDDGGAVIVAGNERVLAARLADAAFFWEQDRKQSLDSRVPALADMVFHAKLGTLAEKVTRMEALAAALATYIEGCDAAKAARAARLAKADLVTDMVGEFPELQGVMGRYYALQDGEDPAVAQAIAEHYAPLGPSDACPSAPVSVAVALADKLDTLAGFWAIDEKPTGSKDPFALRRAALGVIRLIVENGLRLPLRAIFDSSSTEYLNLMSDALTASLDGADERHTIERFDSDLLAFFADRLKVVLRDKGVRHDLVAAVFALGGEDDLVRLLARVEALTAFVGSDDGANLLTAHGRAANIVRIEKKKDKAAFNGAVDEGLLAEPEEKALHDALQAAQAATTAALETEDFGAAMSAMAALRPPVDAFFDQVTVNAEDAALRANRLCLLSAIDATLKKVADFSKIEG